MFGGCVGAAPCAPGGGSDRVIRTRSSPSAISSSAIPELSTNSISVLSLRRSIHPPPPAGVGRKFAGDRDRLSSIAEFADVPGRIGLNAAWRRAGYDARGPSLVSELAEPGRRDVCLSTNNRN